MNELRVKIFYIVADPPCQKECRFWDNQGHYCFLEDIREYPDCPLMKKIMDAIGVIQ